MADSALMDALTGLEPGDDVSITVVREGEELDGHVTEAYHERPELANAGVFVPGSVHVNLDLANSAVDILRAYEGEWFQNATQNADIRAKERRPGCGMTSPWLCGIPR